MLRIGPVTVEGDGKVLAEIFVALISNSSTLPEGQVKIAGPTFSYSGDASGALKILSLIQKPIIPFPYFTVDEGELVVVFPSGEKKSATRNNTVWLIAKIVKALGCSDEEADRIVSSFRQSLVEKPWRQRNNDGRKNGNAKKVAELSTTV